MGGDVVNKTMNNNLPYSPSRIYESMIFTSGQLPINLETKKIEVTTIEEQTNIIFDNIENILLKDSSSLDNIICLKVYLTDMDNLEIVNTLFRKKLNKPYPARTAIEVSKLPSNSQIEIETIAYKN